MKSREVDRDDNERLLALYEMVESLGEQTKAVIAQGQDNERQTRGQIKRAFDALVALAEREIRRIDSRVDEVRASGFGWRRMRAVILWCLMRNLSWVVAL